MEKLANVHPGEVLNEEFLIPMGISAYRLSKELYIPQTRISEILKGKRRVTADTALRLSAFFGNSAKFWLGLQDDYDVEEEIRAQKDEFNLIQKFAWSCNTILGSKIFHSFFDPFCMLMIDDVNAIICCSADGRWDGILVFGIHEFLYFSDAAVGGT